MSLFVRRLVFYFLLFAFVIIAPVIITYTAGYRYSFTQRRVVKTGALSLMSVPTDANIILNGAILTQTTPTLVTELTPGNYEIRIKRHGYHEWQKTLLVESSTTTFAHDIPLFKNATPRFVSIANATAPVQDMPPPLQSLKPYMVFQDKKLGQITVIDNERQARIAQLRGAEAVWWKKPEPTLIIASSHEVSELNPKTGVLTLLTRLIEEIKKVIPLPHAQALILILPDRVRAIERDLRNRQNTWDLATFDIIKNATLSEDGKTLLISGIREGKEGEWELEL